MAGKKEKPGLQRARQDLEGQRLSQRLFSGQLLDKDPPYEDSVAQDVPLTQMSAFLVPTRSGARSTRGTSNGLRMDSSFVKTLDSQISRSLMKVNDVMVRLEQIQQEREQLRRRPTAEPEATPEVEIVLSSHNIWQTNGEIIMDLVQPQPTGSGSSTPLETHRSEYDSLSSDLEDRLESYPLHRRRNALWGEREEHFGTLCAPPRDSNAIPDAEYYRGDMGSIPTTADDSTNTARTRHGHSPIGNSRGMGITRGARAAAGQDSFEDDLLDEAAYDKYNLARLLQGVSAHRRSRGGNGPGSEWSNLPNASMLLGDYSPSVILGLAENELPAFIISDANTGAPVPGGAVAAGPNMLNGLSRGAAFPLPWTRGSWGVVGEDRGAALDNGYTPSEESDDIPQPPIGKRNWRAKRLNRGSAKATGVSATKNGELPRTNAVPGSMGDHPHDENSPFANAMGGGGFNASMNLSMEEGEHGVLGEGSDSDADDVISPTRGTLETKPSRRNLFASTTSPSSSPTHKVVTKPEMHDGSIRRSKKYIRGGSGSSLPRTRTKNLGDAFSAGNGSSTSSSCSSGDQSDLPEASGDATPGDDVQRQASASAADGIWGKWRWGTHGNEEGSADGHTNNSVPQTPPNALAIVDEALVRLAGIHAGISEHIRTILSHDTRLHGKIAWCLDKDPLAFDRITEHEQLLSCLLDRDPRDPRAGHLLLLSVAHLPDAQILSARAMENTHLDLLQLVPSALEHRSVDFISLVDALIAWAPAQPELADLLLQTVAAVPRTNIQLLFSLGETDPPLLKRLLMILKNCPTADVSPLAKVLTREPDVNDDRLVSLLNKRPGAGFEKAFLESSEVAANMVPKLVLLLNVNPDWDLKILQNLITLCPNLDYDALAHLLAQSENVTIENLLAFFSSVPPENHNRMLELLAENKLLTLESASQLASLAPNTLQQLQAVSPNIDLNLMASSINANPALKQHLERMVSTNLVELATLSKTATGVVNNLAVNPDMDMATVSSMVAAALMGAKDTKLTQTIVNMFHKDQKIATQLANAMDCSVEDALAQLKRNDISGMGAFIDTISKRNGNYLAGFHAHQGAVIHESSAKLLAEMGTGDASELQAKTIEELMLIYNDAVAGLRAIKAVDVAQDKVKLVLPNDKYPANHAERMDIIKALMVATHTKPSWSTDKSLLATFGGIFGTSIGAKANGSQNGAARRKNIRVGARPKPAGLSLAAALRQMVTHADDGTPLLGLPGRMPMSGEEAAGFLPSIGGKALVSTPKHRYAPVSLPRAPATLPRSRPSALDHFAASGTPKGISHTPRNISRSSAIEARPQGPATKVLIGHGGFHASTVSASLKRDRLQPLGPAKVQERKASQQVHSWTARSDLVSLPSGVLVAAEYE